MISLIPFFVTKSIGTAVKALDAYERKLKTQLQDAEVAGIFSKEQALPHWQSLIQVSYTLEKIKADRATLSELSRKQKRLQSALHDTQLSAAKEVVSAIDADIKNTTREWVESNSPSHAMTHSPAMTRSQTFEENSQKFRGWINEFKESCLSVFKSQRQELDLVLSGEKDCPPDQEQTTHGILDYSELEGCVLPYMKWTTFGDDPDLSLNLPHIQLDAGFTPRACTAFEESPQVTPTTTSFPALAVRSPPPSPPAAGSEFETRSPNHDRWGLGSAMTSNYTVASTATYHTALQEQGGD